MKKFVDDKARLQAMIAAAQQQNQPRTTNWGFPAYGSGASPAPLTSAPMPAGPGAERPRKKVD